MSMLVQKQNVFHNIDTFSINKSNNYGVNYIDRRKINLQCINCSNKGHLYKTCNHPIISYGIICYKKNFDNNGNLSFHYLMVQRKDSLSYVEFIRGKYQIEKKNYILKLFSNMTQTERLKIINCEFHDLWKEMWRKDDNDKNKNFNKEFNDSYCKFNFLKIGYFISNDKNKIFFDFNYILNNTLPIWEETEWGFPKGRRNINESNINCAIREFTEETGIHNKLITMNNIKPFDEIFTGSNKIRYKHIYFIAELNCDYSNKDLFDPNNKLQCREIRDVKFFSYQDVLDKIRNTNVERRELFKRAHSTINKLFC